MKLLDNKITRKLNREERDEDKIKYIKVKKRVNERKSRNIFNEVYPTSTGVFKRKSK